ncbi:MogA/MoaB family molybdenum cofactor biosynthesis protein [Poriferisphaera sp. WC338]|uniref:MogA/MoaB family molybdenum cofactor biosynthesis protein n=1 Tax=Poriferisphaera sp. WC338 TaxID=3425129 RepID=UPI003D81822B
MSESTGQHRQQAQGHTANCAILTVSDTRTPDTDASGKHLMSLLQNTGHHTAEYAIVKDDANDIEDQLLAWLDTKRQGKQINAILTTGGTGIARRDTTVEIVSRMIDKELDGFGEIFRMLSYQEIGAAAMLSRAVAGLLSSGGQETFIFTMPGSKHAVDLAMQKLILPELSHLIWERKR